ncbi:MAG: hypothetical protein KAR20_10840, partial [Candidatus Heimdallarchaeota archaeon]|nr:hypothetical protein [Candidatus Heimdallarchaeota archaeon]
MNQSAEMANQKTKNQSEPNNEQKYTTYSLDVKGKEFKISNADLKINEIEHHPATRIVFENPYMEWLIYFLDGTYYSILRDENGHNIIPTVKSQHQPWQDDKKRDKKIIDAFNLKGWKKTDTALVLNVVHTAYINHRELGEFLFQPQLVMMEADETDNDNPNPKTAQITASDIIYLIENDVLKNELKNKMFSVDGRPYLVIPHCEGIMTRDTVKIPSYDHMDIDHGIKNMYNLTDKGSETLRSELQRLCRIKHGMTAKNAVIKEAISAFQGDA